MSLKLRATDVFDPTNWIHNPTIISAQFEDDTPSYYAVPQDLAKSYISSFNSMNNCKAVTVHPDDLPDHAWVGIKVTSTNGVAAWGRAKISKQEPTHD